MEIAAETPSPSPSERLRAARAAGGRSPKAKGSRITNGSTLLPTASGCSIWARLMREALANLVAHAGGADVVSETQKLAARRVAFLEAELVYLENEVATVRQAGGEPDPARLDLYGRLADRQRRLADPLGWHRTPRDVTPTLHEIAAGIAARKQEGDPL
jgi:hypothetical protein